MPAGPRKDGYLQAMPLAQMDMQAGNNEFMVMMLLIDQPGGQLARVVVVDEHDYRYLLALGSLPFFADEPIANEIANRLAARGVTFRCIALVKCLQQCTFKRDADSSEIGHGSKFRIKTTGSVSSQSC